jgi:hypothetical protein
VLTTILIIFTLLLASCTQKDPADDGVAQIPVEAETALDDIVGDGETLTWRASFISAPPLTYSREARNVFVTGRDFTVELSFSEIVDQQLFEEALRRGLVPTGGDPAMSWENKRTVLFDVRGCEGRSRIDFTNLAKQLDRSHVDALVIYCGSGDDVFRWNADEGAELIATIPANFSVSHGVTDGAAVFFHEMRAGDGGYDEGVWLSDFGEREIKPLTIHYRGSVLAADWMEESSLVASTGGDDIQLFGHDGNRVRIFDPPDMGVIVGMKTNERRGQVAVFEGVPSKDGGDGRTELVVLDRNFQELARIEDAGTLSRLSGQFRTVDAVWLDASTVAFIYWNNRFYGVVAIADISNLTLHKTRIVADELAGVLTDGRFVVRRQAGGRRGCWRVESIDDPIASPLCDRLPGPSHATVSPDGSLIALQMRNAGQISVWNRVSEQRREIGSGVVAGWTPNGDLVWTAKREALVVDSVGMN